MIVIRHYIQNRIDVSNEIEIDATKVLNDDNDNVYVVSEILDDKGKGNNKRLLIKWKGYKTPTWERYNKMLEARNGQEI